MPKTPQRSNTRTTKETFHVLVEAEGQAVFANATAHIGGEWPFRKPQLTAAVRVSDEIVAFSVLRPTKDTLARLVAKPIQFPKGPLARLERRARDVELTDDANMVVEITTRLPFERDDKPAEPAPSPAPAVALDDLFADPAPAAEQPAPEEAPRRRPQRPTRIDTYQCHLSVDSTGVARVEEIGDEDTVFELPRTAMNVTVYLPGARGRRLAIGWIGYFGQSGKPETVARAAGMVLNALSQLPEFRILSGVEHVSLPASPAARTRPRLAAAQVSDAEFPVKLYLIAPDQATPVARGEVAVRIDLENANPSSGRLLIHYTPDEAIAEHFEQYKAVVDYAVNTALTQELGDAAINELVYDVVLGSVDHRTVETLVEIGRKIGAIDATPTTYQPHAA